MSLLGEGPLGEYPLGDFDLSTSLSVADALADLLSNPLAARSWLIKAFPRDPNTSTSPPTLVSTYVSTDGHKSYSTDDDELQYLEEVVTAYSQQSSLPGIGLYNLAVSTFGEIVLSGVARAGLDWIGRDVDIYLGPRGGTQVQFGRVARMQSRSVSFELDETFIQVDPFDLLLNEPLHTTFYAGTGGLEGGSDIKGNPKPELLGERRLFTPVEVDPVNRIYQIHNGAFDSIVAVLDEGVAKTFHNDVADITTATPPAGKYSTSLANGYIKLGDKNGAIRVSARGHNSSSLGYVDSFSKLVRLLVGPSFAGLLDPGELDTGSFSTQSSYTATMGEYFTQLITIREAIDTFLLSAGAHAVMKPNKIFKVGRATDPDAVTTPVDTIKESDITGQGFRVDTFEVPVGRVFIRYRPYDRLSETDINASVPVATAADYKQPWRVAKSEITTSEREQIERSVDITIDTRLINESDAQSLADEIRDLRKSVNGLARLPVRKGLISRVIGDVVKLEHSKLPVSPKNILIVGLSGEGGSTGDSLVLTGFIKDITE